MEEKYKRYWLDILFLYGLGLFLDPRFKLSVVNGVITELGHYLGHDYTSYLTDFKHKLDRLFSLYENRYNGSGSGSGTSRRGDQDLDAAPLKDRASGRMWDVAEAPALAPAHTYINQMR